LLEHQVEVVAQQAVGEHRPPVAADRLIEQPQEVAPIDVVEEDGRTAVPARVHVNGWSGGLTPRSSRHWLTVELPNPGRTDR